MKREDLSAFDPQADFSVVERALPHWHQAGTICFITWRLADSLPRQALEQLDEAIKEVLENDNLSTDWKQQFATRSPSARGKVHRKLFQARDKFLDTGYGECWLASPGCAAEVLKSLRYFDEDRYFLTDVIVMPNHVHFLCAFNHEAAMLKQCEDWKRYMARMINKRVGRTGELWQVDQFDHLIRSPEQFEHYRRYISDNPKKAGLTPGQFLHYTKPLV